MGNIDHFDSRTGIRHQKLSVDHFGRTSSRWIGLLGLVGLAVVVAAVGFGGFSSRTIANDAAPPSENGDDGATSEGDRDDSDSKPNVSADADSDDEDDEAILDPLGPNAACYVCHMTFVHEELARVHLAEKITCIKCHGLSAAHANDEDIGATPPDITFELDKIDASCEECHEKHDVPPRDVVARWLERKIRRPKAVCTDCHGMHRIEHADEADGDDEEGEAEKTS